MCVIRSTSTRDRTKISSQVTFKKRICILYDIQKKEKKWTKMVSAQRSRNLFIPPPLPCG